MRFQHAETSSLILFSILMLAEAVCSLRKIPGSSLWLCAFTALLVLGSGLTLSGMMAKNILPLAPIYVGLLFLFGISFSKTAGLLAQQFSLVVLIGVQGFRFP